MSGSTAVVPTGFSGPPLRAPSEISNATKLEISRKFNGAKVFSVGDLDNGLKQQETRKTEIESAINSKFREIINSHWSYSIKTTNQNEIAYNEYSINFEPVTSPVSPLGVAPIFSSNETAESNSESGTCEGSLPLLSVAIVGFCANRCLPNIPNNSLIDLPTNVSYDFL